MKKGGVAIVGALPPPYGGVTTHLDRLTRRLDEAALPYTVYDGYGKSLPDRHCVPGGRGLRWFVRFLWEVEEHVVHMNTNNGVALMVAACVLPMRGRQVVFSLHSEAIVRAYQQWPAPVRILWQRLIRRVSTVMCVNQAIADWLIQEVGLPGGRVIVSPAFLPPTDSERDPKHIRGLHEFLASHHPIVGTHGWFGYFIDGVHVYSFDMIPEMILSLRRRYKSVGVYTLVSGTYCPQHRKVVYAQRRRLGLEHDWRILEGFPNAPSLLRLTDVLVRPTITDGDSVTVREALSVGTPVVVSDVVARPSAAILFPNRDFRAMMSRIKEVLADPPARSTVVAAAKHPDTAASLIEVYQKLLRRQDGRP